MNFSWLLQSSMIARLVLCLLVAAAPAHAEVRLVIDEVAPFAFRDGPRFRGVSYELMTELAARTGHSGTIAVVPLMRELEMIKRDDNAIGPLGRLREREHSYTWIAKLFEEQVVLVTSAGSTVDVSTVHAARHLRLGVIGGGPAGILARELGFVKIDSATTAEQNAHKLAAGRIDAWLVAWGVAAHGQRMSGQEVNQLRRGAVLQRFSMYLAGSPTLSPAEIAKWRRALAAMKKDGSYQRILKAYSYAVPEAE